MQKHFLNCERTKSLKVGKTMAPGTVVNSGRLPGGPVGHTRLTHDCTNYLKMVEHVIYSSKKTTGFSNDRNARGTSLPFWTRDGNQDRLSCMKIIWKSGWLNMTRRASWSRGSLWSSQHSQIWQRTWLSLINIHALFTSF